MSFRNERGSLSNTAERFLSDASMVANVALRLNNQSICTALHALEIAANIAQLRCDSVQVVVGQTRSMLKWAPVWRLDDSRANTAPEFRVQAIR